MTFRILFFLSISISIWGAGCRAKKTAPETASPNPPVAEIRENPSLEKADSLYQAVQLSGLKSRWFSARVNVDAEIDKERRSFNANLRVCRDSAIWMSISPALGIEVARVLIAKDSVKFINRLNSTYFVGGFGYLNEMLQVEVNFKMIEAVLTGSAYLHYTVDKYITDRENGDLVLSTLKKRRIRRENELDIPQILTQEIWFSPLNNKIKRMELQDYRPIRKFNVVYPSFETVEETVVPNRMEIEAAANKQVKILLDYSKITLNKELNLPFAIPDGYEPVRR